MNDENQDKVILSSFVIIIIILIALFERQSDVYTQCPYMLVHSPNVYETEPG